MATLDDSFNRLRRTIALLLTQQQELRKLTPGDQDDDKEFESASSPPNKGQQLRNTAQAARAAVDQLKQELETIGDQADKIAGKSGLADKANFPKRLAELDDRFDEIEKLVSDEAVVAAPAASPPSGQPPAGSSDRSAEESSERDDGELDLREFFRDVSMSMIDAQRRLNRNSLEYIANLPPGIPAAQFAIPAVKAELKAGFRKAKGSGINVILFSSKKSREEYGETTVNFELVAAPPVPGPNSEAASLVPMPGLLVVGSEKEQLLDELLALSPVAKVGANLNDPAARRRAVVLTRFEASDRSQHYLVLWPGKADVPPGHTEPEPWYWSQFTAFSAVRRPDEASPEQETLQLVTDIFDKGKVPDEKLLNIGTKADLDGMNKAELVDFVTNLGDMLMNVVLAVDGWMQDVPASHIQKHG